jgi:hypothetical protein
VKLRSGTIVAVQTRESHATSSAGSDNHFGHILFVTIEYIFTSYSVWKLFITIVKRIRRQQVKEEDKLLVTGLSDGGRGGATFPRAEP